VVARDGRSLGKVRFGQPTSKLFQEEIELAFFRSWLKDGVDPRLPEAYVFETGRKQWGAKTRGLRGREPLAPYLAAGGAWRSGARRDGRGLRRSVSDPPAGPLHAGDEASA